MTTMNILRRMSILVAAFALIAPRAAAADFVFSITEGVTYYQTNREIQARFQVAAAIIVRPVGRSCGPARRFASKLGVGHRRHRIEIRGKRDGDAAIRGHPSDAVNNRARRAHAIASAGCKSGNRLRLDTFRSRRVVFRSLGLRCLRKHKTG